jgi:DNA-binding transcriptional ArsR family regulator
MSRRRSARARIDAAAPIFAALGDETRLALVVRLGRNGPASIAALTEGAAVTRQAITKHLLVLERAGVVHGERRGREHVWSVQPRALDDARRCLDEVSAQWDGAIDRLRAHLERDPG